MSNVPAKNLEELNRMFTGLYRLFEEGMDRLQDELSAESKRRTALDFKVMAMQQSLTALEQRMDEREIRIVSIPKPEQPKQIIKGTVYLDENGKVVITPNEPEQPKSFDPERDDFYAFLFVDGRNQAFLVEHNNCSKEYTAFLISIGNCFATREEAENEGKWLFQDKLVLDEELRKAGCSSSVKYLDWDFSIEKPVYEAGFHPKSFEDAIAILGTNAKRYLTGVV